MSCFILEEKINGAIQVWFVMLFVYVYFVISYYETGLLTRIHINIQGTKIIIGRCNRHQCCVSS